jgi:hypothetical protein
MPPKIIDLSNDGSEIEHSVKRAIDLTRDSDEEDFSRAGAKQKKASTINDLVVLGNEDGKRIKRDKQREDNPPQREGSKKTQDAWKLSKVKEEGQKRSKYKEAVKQFKDGRQHMNDYILPERKRFLKFEKKDKESAQKYVDGVKNGQTVCLTDATLRNMKEIANAPSQVDKFWKLESPYNSDLSYTDMGFTDDGSDLD